MSKNTETYSLPSYEEIKKYDDPVTDLFDAYRIYLHAVAKGYDKLVTDLRPYLLLAIRILQNPYYLENKDRLSVVTEDIVAIMGEKRVENIVGALETN